MGKAPKINATILTNATSKVTREDTMKTPDFVDQILQLTKLGWGKKRIAKELGTTVKTVRRYVRQEGWRPYERKVPPKKLEGLEDWLEASFRQHRCNAAVVHQELVRQHQILVSLRTIERALKPLRRKLEIQAKSTVRYETPPGKQMQIDFGSMTLKIAGESKRVYFFVATLGYSRRPYVSAFFHERQASWFEGMEGAFRHFGGIPEEVLLDNAKALVTKHNPVTREVIFNDRLLAFANYWNFKPKACAPYRARTKGKDESGVKYLKRNCIAGREFSNWEELQAHLIWWMREIADKRLHGTTGERPIDRFQRGEVSELRSLEGRPPFYQIQEVTRSVQTDSCVEVGTNRYSVPWRYIGEDVRIQVIEEEVIIFQGSVEIARHAFCRGQKNTSINYEHLSGIVGANWLKKQSQAKASPIFKAPPHLLRPLAEYEAIAGGGW